MNKPDLIHTTILIVGILCGYSALQSILYILTILSDIDLYHLRSQDTAFVDVHLFLSSTGNILPTIVNVALFSAACIILVRNGKKYAAAILHWAEPGTADENSVEVQLDRYNILFALFIGIGLYTLIQALPNALYHSVQQFTDKVSNDLYKSPSPGKDRLIMEWLRVTIGALLIYVAPTLTNFIESTIAVRLDSGSQSS
jgi:small-conductance mechanosensitive channel